MTRVSNEAKAQRIAKVVTADATAVLKSGAPKEQSTEKLRALGAMLFAAGFQLRDPNAGLLPAPVRKAYERLIGLAYQVDKNQDLVVAFARGFSPAKDGPERKALDAEKAAAIEGGRMPLHGPLLEQSQRAIDRYVEKVSIKRADVKVIVTGSTSSYDIHEVLQGMALLHPGKSIAISSPHGSVVEDFPATPNAPPSAISAHFLGNPALVSALVGMIAKDYPGVKTASFQDGTFVARVTDQFDAGDASEIAKTVRILLGDGTAVRVLRHTKGELPGYVVTNGYPAQVYPDGTKSAVVAYSKVPDELKALGVRGWDGYYGRGITLRLADTATAAEAMQASQAAARITGSDYAQVWFSGYPDVSSTGESLTTPIRVTKADREAFEHGILDAYTHAHSVEFYGHWPEAPGGNYDDAGYKAEVSRYMDDVQREGFVDATGALVNVEPWFDAAGVKGLVDDVRARLAKLPGFDNKTAQDVRVDVRRKTDGSEVNRGKGGWAVTAQTNPGPEPYLRFQPRKT